MSIKQISNQIECNTFIDVFQSLVEKKPNALAFSILRDGEFEKDQITYLELENRIKTVSSFLQKRNFAKQRVLLLFPTHLDFIVAFLGCLYAEVIAVPVYLPEPNFLEQELSRIQEIVLDAQTPLVLTTNEIELVAKEHIATKKESFLNYLEWLSLDQMKQEDNVSWVKPEIKPETVAFLHYTYNSLFPTSGIIIRHQNLLYNEEMLKESCQNNEDTIYLGLGPICHGLGLIGTVLQSLYVGAPCYLIPAIEFLKKPIIWLKAISKYKVTTSGAPNFAYDLCNQLSENEIKPLKLDCWRVALTSSEPIQTDVMKAFSKKFSPYGFQEESFHPCYGTGEATLFISGGIKGKKAKIIKLDAKKLSKNKLEIIGKEKEAKFTRELVSLGTSWLEGTIKIVNPKTLLECNDQEIGEIWVLGPHLAAGYWNEPKETKNVFQASLVNSNEGPFLRTGDLGFIYQDELFVSGSLKESLIQGQHITAQDLEQKIASKDVVFPELQAGLCVVFTIEVDGQEKIVIFQELDPDKNSNFEPALIATTIRESLFNQFDILIDGIFFLKKDCLPKNSSRKEKITLCRKAFRSKFEEGDLELLYQDIFSADGEPILQNVIKIETSAPKAKETTTKSESEEDANQLIAWLREYGETRINSQLIDERRCIPPNIILDFGNKGLLGMQVPKSYEGLALDTVDLNKVMQQLAAMDLTLASFVCFNNFLGISPLLNYAKKEWKEAILPSLAKGRELTAFAVTEPGAGSNFLGIVSQANVNPKGGWKLYGEKSWITSASWAGYISVFVRHPSADPGKEISGFILPQGIKGLKQGPETLTLGTRGMVQNSILLDGVNVFADSLLGEVGQGIEVAQNTLRWGRFGLGALALGGMKKCAQFVLRYANKRSIATGRLIENPVVLYRLNETLHEITALDALVQRLAELLDQNEVIPAEIFSLCKVASSEFLWKATDQALQLLGGRGYSETNSISQMLRDARFLRIFAGPTEALMTYIGANTLNKTDEICTFLADKMGGPKSAKKLRDILAQIQTAYPKKQYSESNKIFVLRKIYYLTGELTLYAFLFGSLEKGENQALVKQSIEELTKRFNSIKEDIFAQKKEEQNLPSVTEISKTIDLYSEAIGFVVQEHKGVDFSVDPLLMESEVILSDLSIKEASMVEAQKTEVSKPLSPEKNAPVTKTFLDVSLVKHKKTKNKKTENEKVIIREETNKNKKKAKKASSSGNNAPITLLSIQDLIINWIHEKIKIPKKEITPTQDFSEFGIDSVFALEFNAFLESKLGCKFPETLFWDHSNLKALSEYLFELVRKEQ